jgi:hypothetical protein
LFLGCVKLLFHIRHFALCTAALRSDRPAALRTIDSNPSELLRAVKQISLASRSIACGGRCIAHIVDRVARYFTSAPLLPIPALGAIATSETEFDQTAYGLRQRRLIGLTVYPLQDCLLQRHGRSKAKNLTEIGTFLWASAQCAPQWLQAGKRVGGDDLRVSPLRKIQVN